MTHGSTTGTTVEHLGRPIDARALFAPEHAALLDTLRALGEADWEREAVPGWTVRDVVAHLAGDYYARLSRDRDGHRGNLAPRPGESLALFIHRINQEWVDAFGRVSPAALVDTVSYVGGQLVRFFESVDLAAPSLGVSWAGVDPAPMWLDAARDFTEFWTHRQQIRHAAGEPTDSAPAALRAVLDTFLRALPHTLRDVDLPAGCQVHVSIDGPAGGRWAVTSLGSHWSLAEPVIDQPVTVVRMDAETAWRLCTRGVSPEAAIRRVEIEGDRRVGVAVCRIVSIIH